MKRVSPLLLRFAVIIFIGLGPLCFASLESAHWLVATAYAEDGETLYFPQVAKDSAMLATRIGFGLTNPPLTHYPTHEQLNAGWYLDWRVTEHPLTPRGIEYVQVVRVHQQLACGLTHHSDRTVCPYQTPYNYIYSPAADVITRTAQANRGSLWLIGNEMDRRDWAYCVRWNGTHCEQVAYTGQDEILPETYATAFHDLATLIRSADPTARIAIGGVIQATPLRLQYLTRVWDSYQAQYGEPMPVDVWNVHNFILQERKNNYGADIPPGLDETSGAYLDDAYTHVNITYFAQQIRDFRQWMKDRGQQEKPLIVSEYGVLYRNENLGFPSNDPNGVANFLEQTFTYFLHTTDCSLGYTADGCRLVQRWNWFSLDDIAGDYNVYSRLLQPDTLLITPSGERFAAFTRQYSSLLRERGY